MIIFHWNMANVSPIHHVLNKIQKIIFSYSEKFSGHNITDVAGNPFVGTINLEETYTIDNTAPSLVFGAAATRAEGGAPVSLSFEVTRTIFGSWQTISDRSSFSSANLSHISVCGWLGSQAKGWHRCNC